MIDSGKEALVCLSSAVRNEHVGNKARCHEEMVAALWYTIIANGGDYVVDEPTGARVQMSAGFARRSKSATGSIRPVGTCISLSPDEPTTCLPNFPLAHRSVS
jgi:hypothetical protein